MTETYVCSNCFTTYDQVGLCEHCDAEPLLDLSDPTVQSFLKEEYERSLPKWPQRCIFALFIAGSFAVISIGAAESFAYYIFVVVFIFLAWLASRAILHFNEKAIAKIKPVPVLPETAQEPKTVLSFEDDVETTPATASQAEEEVHSLVDD